ncbi:hypothetical protein, partial [Klebsiella pneumoniae]|uniref:hypothetical protein n=1 Tax=Klebsiella pneumoniae TaxID=573 RepID=UPI00195456A0
PAAEQALARADHVRQKEALTFRALGERFLADHVEAKRKGRTASNYRTLLTLHAYPVIGDQPAAVITRQNLSRLHLAMRDTPHNANR